MLRIAAACVAICLSLQVRAEVVIDVGYLHVETTRPPVLSNLDPVPDDIGVAGALTGLNDINTTGVFLERRFSLNTETVALGEEPLAVAAQMLGKSGLLVLDAPTEVLTAIADLPEAKEALLFNTSSGDVGLRDGDCRSNLLHTLPSLAMQTDALAQFFLAKRWSELVMISGTHPPDQSYADAVRRSVTKFGLKLKAEKIWDSNADMRRSAASEVPLFTQDLGDYDALIVADEVHDFGRYVLYNTWQARPVAGSEGLTAITWSPVIEEWGAAQLQKRFERLAGRGMMSRDYAAWAAIRVIGEAVFRSGSSDPQEIRSYILSDDFELAGFKGRPLTFRKWNGQLRQPIALSHVRALVAMAPLEGFMHQTNELDSLGLDRPESTCGAFQ